MPQDSSRISAALAALGYRSEQVLDCRAQGGGCINEAWLLSLADGRRLFLKTQARPPGPGYFEAEAEALRLLAESAALAVPRPLAAGPDFLVLEAFSPGRPAPDWQQRLGEGLARLHLGSRQQRFGFPLDNWLGLSPQPNAWLRDGIAFWRDRRLGWQLTLWERRAPPGDALLALGRRLLERLDERLAGLDEAPVLLHGDLWVGNAAALADGSPVIFDPASYYGWREAEYAMMRLFGGFGPRCEAASQEIWPFAPGFEERQPLFRLYHELNHLNLFGGGYYQDCLRSVRSLL